MGVAILRSSSMVTLPANHIGPVPLGLRGSSGGALVQLGAGLDLMRNAPVSVHVRGDFVRVGNEIGNMLRLAVVHLDR